LPRKSDDLYLSAITIGEIYYGICRLPVSAKRAFLQQSFTLLRSTFADRILPFSETEAIRWGEEVARARPLAVFDSLIAATALEHGMRWRHETSKMSNL
jgi:predicted nucleic acid-binding protein